MVSLEVTLSEKKMAVKEMMMLKNKTKKQTKKQKTTTTTKKPESYAKEVWGRGLTLRDTQ